MIFLMVKTIIQSMRNKPTSQLLHTRWRFFWEGVGNKKKYHMIKWEALASPKEFGGLGFVDTRAMNKALLAKWIYKLDRGDNTLALEVL